jgi:hypothetical protein
MKRFLIAAVVTALSATALLPNLRACEPGRCSSRRTAANAPAPSPAPPAAPANDTGTEDDTPPDLANNADVPTPKEPRTQRPADGRGVPAASRPRTYSQGVARPTVAPTPSRATAPAPSPTTRAQGLSFHDRVAQAITTQQALLTANARLEAKLAELQRWDEAAQDKFRRAFGTTEERVRQAVAQRLLEQRQKNLQALATITDGMNLEFYLQSKKPR